MHLYPSRNILKTVIRTVSFLFYYLKISGIILNIAPLRKLMGTAEEDFWHAMFFLTFAIFLVVLVDVSSDY